MSAPGASFFHLHLVSDATGEALMTVARAAVALVRTHKQMDRILAELESSPGIVLYTLLDTELSGRLEQRARELGCPIVSVLDPVLSVFRSYLGAGDGPRIGAQHTLNADYFKRIDALNFTMMQDDGQHPENLDKADVILVGVSRTSKTPTAIYLANRGVKTANIPLVPDIPPPPELFQASEPLIVGLIASPERIVQIRHNRLEALSADTADTPYVDRMAVSREVANSRRLCTERAWPVIDVTRRSIEETAAAILELLGRHRQERATAAANA
jgi:[pyruvate, water dikinase]-phosphate phosphotransferase / [pyruvate, water dikinase] kinase